MRRTATGISEQRRRLLRLAAALLSLAWSPGTFAAEKKEPAKGEGAVEGPTFIRLNPIVLPVFSGEKLTRQAGLVLALELEPGKTAEEFEPNRRRLTDAFITDLYDLYDQLGGSGRVIEPAVIKERLLAASARVLGPGFVREVLIQQAYERPRS